MLIKKKMKHDVLRFKHFTRSGYALFACLGKVVLISTLAVPMLAHAKASGAGVLPETADTLSAGSERETMLDEVSVTGTRAPLSQLQAAKMVTVISRDDINRVAVNTVNDVLKLATGVDVRQRGGFGVQTDISINGGTFDQIAILLNGVPIGNPQTGHNATDFPVSLSDIERIEVLEGGAARVFGTSAFSGAVNIVTRKSVDKRSIVASVEGGSYGTFGIEGGYADGGRRSENHWQVTASGGYNRSDGGTLHSDFEKGRAFVQGLVSFSESLDVNAQVGFSTQSYGANTFYSVKYNNQYEKTDHLLASLDVSLHDANHTWEVKPIGYFNRFLDHYQLIRGVPGASAGENYHALNVLGGGANAYLSWALGKTAVGADVRQEVIYSTAYGRKFEENQWKNIHGSDRMYDKRGERTNTSLFLEHNIVVGGLTLSAGVMANMNTGLDHCMRFYPGVDVSYRVTDQWKLFASWNKALRMPTYTDLYTSNSVQQGDVNLMPEKNSTFKVGSSYQKGILSAQLSAFYSKARNMIDWVYESETSTKYHALNIGELENIGVSMDATLNMAKAFNNPLVTRMRVGYAYIHQNHETEHEIYKSLYALEYLRHKLTAEVDHHIVSRLSAAWTMRWQQHMNGFHPYTKIDCRLQWTEPFYTLYLKADNLTAHRYYDLGGVLQPGLWIMAGIRINL